MTEAFDGAAVERDGARSAIQTVGATTCCAADRPGADGAGGIAPSEGGSGADRTACHHDRTQEWPTMTLGLRNG